jgi:uncharacterized protein (DUF1499 family)
MTRLTPCPDKPNCVSSRAAAGHPSASEPWTFAGSADEARERLLRVLEDAGLAVEEIDGHYVHAIHTSRFLRFKDDVEFEIEPDDYRIHHRSASRVGHWDLGVNRRRMEMLRQAFDG